MRMRTLKKRVNLALPILGVAVMLTASLVVHEGHVRALIVLGGLLLMQAAVWDLAQRVLPEERQFHALRQEVDAFINLCGQLHHAALAIKADNRQTRHDAFNQIQTQMLAKVDQITAVAGQTNAELAGELSRSAGGARART